MTQKFSFRYFRVKNAYHFVYEIIDELFVEKKNHLLRRERDLLEIDKLDKNIFKETSALSVDLVDKLIFKEYEELMIDLSGKLIFKEYMILFFELQKTIFKEYQELIRENTGTFFKEYQELIRENTGTLFKEYQELIREATKILFKEHLMLHINSSDKAICKGSHVLILKPLIPLDFFDIYELCILKNIILTKKLVELVYFANKAMLEVEYEKIDVLTCITWLEFEKCIDIATLALLEKYKNDIHLEVRTLLEEYSKEIHSTKDVELNIDKSVYVQETAMLNAPTLECYSHEMISPLFKSEKYINISVYTWLETLKYIYLVTSIEFETGKAIFISTDRVLKNEPPNIQLVLPSLLKDEKDIYIAEDSTLETEKYINTTIDNTLEAKKYIDITTDSALKTDKYIDITAIDVIFRRDRGYIDIAADNVLDTEKYINLNKDVRLKKTINEACIARPFSVSHAAYDLMYLQYILNLKAYYHIEYLQSETLLSKEYLEAVFYNYCKLTKYKSELSMVKASSFYKKSALEVILGKTAQLIKLFKLFTCIKKENHLSKISEITFSDFTKKAELIYFGELFNVVRENFLKWDTEYHLCSEDENTCMEFDSILEVRRDISRRILESIYAPEIFIDMNEQLLKMQETLIFMLIDDVSKLLNINALGRFFRVQADHSLLLNYKNEFLRDGLDECFLLENDIELFAEKPKLEAERGMQIDTSSLTSSLECDSFELVIERIMQLLDKADLEILVANDSAALTVYRRGWFIRGTAPTDLLILPNIDYPYAKKPVSVTDYYKDWDVYYWHFEEISNVIETHPLPLGSELGSNHIEVSIEIMVDIVNIILMLWSKFYSAFEGWHGVGAIKGLMIVIYNWLALESSIEEMHIKDSFDDYMRCYRWLRWEAEVMIHKAREDYTIGGNRWVELYVMEIFRYLWKHHFDTIPVFKNIVLMDLMRDIFRDPQGDIDIVLDKLKGMRFYSIEEERRDCFE